MMKPAILTHCGAGSDKTLQDAADKSALAGFKILRNGGSALEAVEEAIVVLEDDPRTNAGIGSRRRTDGTVQMDAALMDSDLRTGAVAAIMNVRNPIRVARLVMEDSPHVLIAGEGATLFARKHGIPFFDPSTSLSWNKWQDSMVMIRSGKVPGWASKWRDFKSRDTVGAVARDGKGRFATGSSTAGTSLMLPGRVGDSPIVGAGLYAGPAGAVTATGIGEEIIRVVLSKMAYDLISSGATAEVSCEKGLALFSEEVPMGLIAVDKKGWGEAANRDMAYAALPRR